MITETNTDWLQSRKGKFTASSIWKLFVEPRSKSADWSETALTYIREQAVERYTGYKKSFSNEAMTHGVTNEQEAFEVFTRLTDMPFEMTSSQFFSYNEFSGASPDGVLYDDNLNIIAVVDVKCPFNPLSYFEQKLLFQNEGEMPREYFYQINLQMMSTGAKTGFLARYLTSSNTDSFGNKFEFDLPEKDRMFYQYIDADMELFEKIDNKIRLANIRLEEFIESFKK
jgi:hypothetical protein